MKRVIWVVTFLVTLAAASTALAWKKPPFESVDSNRDGKIIFEEIRIFNPKGMTLEVFAIIDLNKDGHIDRAEYAAMGGRRAKTSKAWKKRWWRCSGREGMTLYMQGTDLLVAGKNAEAAGILRQAITKPLCVDYLSYSYYNLGIACMRLGDDACARKNLEEARALNINNVVPPNTFGLDGTPRVGGKQ
jgi:tetratricopeptide (TPR) repeat protein